MKTLNHIKEEIKMALAKGVEATISKLEQMLSHQSSSYTDLLQIKGRYEDSQHKFKMGLIPYETASLIANQVRYALLTEIVVKLDREDFQQQYMPDENFPEKSKSILPFDLKVPRFKMDVLRLDRKNAASIFNARFNNLKEAPVQHYFIYADRHQQPRSFVERLIFELESKSSILQYDAEGDKHIKLAEPDLEGNLEISKLRLCEYFSERFGTSVSSVSDIPATKTSGGNQMIIASTFKYHIKEWKPYSKAFFEWLFTSFSDAPKGNTAKFIFFHIIQKDSFSARAKGSIMGFLSGKSSKQKLAENTLKQLQKFPNCTVLPELKPISLHDLTKWLEEFISNETAVDKLVKMITGAQVRKDPLDMSFVEDQLINILHQRHELPMV
jgi:hypothetical protein